MLIAGLIMIDLCRIAVVFKSHQEPDQLNLQFSGTNHESDNLYNLYAEFPENDITFNAYSRLSAGESVVTDNPDSENDLFRNLYRYSGFASNINLNHIIICNLDLPPPLFSDFA